METNIIRHGHFPHASPRRSPAFSIQPTILALALCTAVAATGSVHAVESGTVVGGAGNIRTKGNTTTITQSTDRMVVNWNSFDIAKNQTVNIQQPSANSAILNRVTSNAPTQIQGALTANGRVFVINPNGVMFGKNAQVSVGSLVASTLDVDNQQFMSGGRNTLNSGKVIDLNGGSSGTVRNDGKIAAQDTVMLLGNQVSNEGTIRARSTTLGAADGAALIMTDTGFNVVLGRAALNALASNGGLIATTDGNITLSAAATGDLVRAVVKNTGTLEANQATGGKGGSIELSAVQDGAISAGGHLTADGTINLSNSPLAFSDSPFSNNTRPRGDRAPGGHDIIIEAGSKLTASRGAISAAAVDGDLSQNGRMNGAAVYLNANNITINNTIKANSNVNVVAQDELKQNGNISASKAHVWLQGKDIYQASGVSTTAGDYVKVDGSNHVLTANINGKSIDVRGSDVSLGGALKADGDISVQARSIPFHCVADPDVSCIALVSSGGVISQGDNAISRHGNIVMDADKWITQRSGTLTKAAGAVTLTAARVDAGTINAGEKISIEADRASLFGKLKAPEVNLPAGTLNVDGNVVISKNKYAGTNR